MSQAEDLGFDVPEAAAWTGAGLLTILWRRKALVAFGVVVGLVIGVLVYAQRPAVYQTNAQIVVIKKRTEQVTVGSDPRLSYVEDYVSSHLVVIRSPLIVERAIKKRNLQNLRSFAGQDPTGAILGNLVAQRDSKDATSGPNNIINLSWKGPVADDCPIVLSAIIDSYQSFLNEAYQSVSTENLRETRQERDRLKQELEKAKADYKKFRDDHPELVYKGADGVNASLKQVSELKEALFKLQGQKEKVEAQLAEIAEMKAKGYGKEQILSLIDLTASEARERVTLELFPSLREKRIQVEAARAALKGKGYGDGHDDVKALDAQIALFDRAMKEAEELQKLRQPTSPEAVTRAFPDPLDRYVRQLESRRDQFAREMNPKVEQLATASTKALAMDVNEREETEKRGRMDQLARDLEKTTKEMDEMERIRRMGGFDAQELGRPGTGGKTSPVLYQFLLGGCLVGAVAGLSLAYLVEMADKSFRTPEEIRRQLGLPVVGHIPLLTPDADAVVRVAAGEVVPDPFLCVHYRPRTVDAEAYRAVRTALFFSAEGDRHQIIQITSAHQGDGKSTLVSNLAIAIAQSGKSVLIVDADCRRPRQHRILGLEAPVGLAQVLTGPVSLDDAIQKTVVDGLSLLPCGPLPHNPAELLTSPRFAEILTTLRQRYDFVLVDTPPLLAVTDPCVVAARVDSVLLCIRMSRRARPSARRAREILATLGVKILGVVVNGLDRDIHSTYQAPSYGYTGYYTDGSLEPTSAVTATPPPGTEA